MGIFDFFKKNKNIENDNGWNKIFYAKKNNNLYKLEGNKKDGKREGLWKGWYCKAKNMEYNTSTPRDLAFEENYNNGDLKTRINYAPNGSVRNYYTYKEGVKHGPFVDFGYIHTADANIGSASYWKKGNYKNSIQDGIMEITFGDFYALKEDIFRKKKVVMKEIWKQGKCISIEGNNKRLKDFILRYRILN